MGLKFGRELDIIVSKVYVNDSQVVTFMRCLQIEFKNSNVCICIDGGRGNQPLI